ncbi:MAG: hypothetical protein JNK44_18070 [Cyclobacteriaceae bacterium]|nr:hypothetical protein [Cyclobacteriaceae bacterium]
MKHLNLNFLDPNHRKPDRLETILHSFGEEISGYAKGYFYHIVTTTLEYDLVREAALYIAVPEIQYDYRIISLSYVDVENVQVEFYPLKTKQVESNVVSIKEGDQSLVQRIAQLLNGQIASATFAHLINLVEMKRERDDE